MRWDVENQLSVNQAFTGAATVSANSYAKGSAAQDLSIGCRMALSVRPTVAAGAGSTHKLEAIQADDAALTTNVENIGTADGVLAAQLYKGAEIEVPIRQGAMTRKYIGFRHTATGGVTTLSADVYLVAQEDIPGQKVTFPKINNADVN